MKTILYATDFSENAKNALSYAVKIAHQHNAELILMNVFDFPTSWEYPYSSITIEMEREAFKRSEKKLKTLVKEHADSIRTRVLVVENSSVVRAIISTARDNNADLVITGTTGGSKIKEFAFGSTTKELISNCPVPVLAVPAMSFDNNFTKIVYASDLYDQDIKAIKTLISIFKPFNAIITVLHISEADNEKDREKEEWFKEMLLDKVSYSKISFKSLTANNKYNLLSDFIYFHAIDLLVMLEKERGSILDRLFHQDLVKKVESNTMMPLLSFNERYLRLKEDQIQENLAENHSN